MRNLKLKGLKYTKGKFQLFDDRILFFPPQLIDILASIYGEGVKSLLVWLGKKMGWTLSQKWEENLKPKTLEDLVSQFCNILSNQGWGTFNPSKISEEFILIEHHSNISSELENKSKNFCFFITGIMSGFGEFAFYRAKVYESSCSLENPGVNFCEYKIEKVA